VPDAETIEVGDRLILQTNFTFATEQDIRRQLGSGFAEAVMKLEPAKWHGPVLSGYGVHLVYVYDLLTAPAAELEEVQALVLKDWHVQKRDQFNADFLESLKSQFQIVIEELPADRFLESQIEVTGEAATDIIPLGQVDSVS
jgi:hypothetical protein